MTAEAAVERSPCPAGAVPREKEVVAALVFMVKGGGASGVALSRLSFSAITSFAYFTDHTLHETENLLKISAPDLRCVDHSFVIL